MEKLLLQLDENGLLNCLGVLGSERPVSKEKERIVEDIRLELIKSMKVKDTPLDSVAHQALFKLLTQMGSSPTPSLKTEHLLEIFKKALFTSAREQLLVLLRLCLGAAVADGVADSKEQEFIREIMVGVLLPEDEVDSLVTEVIQEYQKHPDRFRHDHLISELKRDQVPDWRLVLSLVHAIHLIDGKVSCGEDIFFQHLSRSSQLSQEDIQEIIKEVSDVFNRAEAQYSGAGIEERLRDRYILTKTIDKMSRKIKQDLLVALAIGGIPGVVLAWAYRLMRIPEYEKLFLFFATFCFEQQKAENSEEVIRVEGTGTCQ